MVFYNEFSWGIKETVTFHSKPTKIKDDKNQKYMSKSVGMNGSAHTYFISTEDIDVAKVFLRQLDRSYIFKKMVYLIHI